jgi:hypothetical protein
MQLNLRLMGMEGPRYLVAIVAGTAIIKAGGVQGPLQDPRSREQGASQPSLIRNSIQYQAERRPHRNAVGGPSSVLHSTCQAPKVAAGRPGRTPTTTPPSRFYKDRASEVRAQAGRGWNAGFSVPEWANRKCRQRLLYSQHLRQPTTETPSTSVVAPDSSQGAGWGRRFWFNPESWRAGKDPRGWGPDKAANQDVLWFFADPRQAGVA